jgi:hypothetical protein
LIVAALALVTASLACGRQQGGATATPLVVVATATPGGVAQATVPAQPTTPPESTSTPLPGGCADGMQFVADVSVPDGTIFGPNESFIKTWRVRNSGSCAWSGYRVMFVSGEPMGTLDQPVPDTPAGEELDVSIEMTAPGLPAQAGGLDAYTGRWQVQSPGGAILGSLTCVIAVQGGEGESPTAEPTQEQPTAQPTEQGAVSTPPSNLRLSGWGMHSLSFAWDDASGEAGYILMPGSDSVSLGADTTSYTWENPPCGTTAEITLIASDAGGAEIGRVSLSGVNTPACPQAQTVTLQSLPAEDGYVRGVTSGEGVTLNGEINVGDGPQDRARQGFFSFDISTIPAGAIIQSATLDLSNHTVKSDPFTTLGSFGVYFVQYGDLDASDYVAGWPPGRATTLNSPPGILNPAHELQPLVDTRTPRFQCRLQFQYISDSDGQADGLTFPEGGPSLTVTYYVP